MPWELIVLRYEGEPPASYWRRSEAAARRRPLGPLQEVRDWISARLPGTEWREQLSLLEIRKLTGEGPDPDWSAEELALASRRTLQALYEDAAGFSLEMFGFADPVDSFFLDVRGTGDPIPAVGRLCGPKGWSVAAMDREGKFLDLSGPAAAAASEWAAFRRWRDRAIEQTRRRQDGGDGKPGSS